MASKLFAVNLLMIDVFPHAKFPTTTTFRRYSRAFRGSCWACVDEEKGWRDGGEGEREIEKGKREDGEVERKLK